MLFETARQRDRGRPFQSECLRSRSTQGPRSPVGQSRQRAVARRESTSALPLTCLARTGCSRCCPSPPPFHSCFLPHGGAAALLGTFAEPSRNRRVASRSLRGCSKLLPYKPDRQS